MSADNGIYILQTKDSYRVIHAQAIENLFWTPLKPYNEELVPTRVLEYYGGTKYTRDRLMALKIADELARGCTILEYGIKTFSTHKSWRQIVNEAKKLAKKEIEYFKNSGKNWDYEIKRLEKIMAM